MSKVCGSLPRRCTSIQSFANHFGAAGIPECFQDCSSRGVWTSAQEVPVCTWMKGVFQEPGIRVKVLGKWEKVSLALEPFAGGTE